VHLAEINRRAFSHAEGKEPGPKGVLHKLVPILNAPATGGVRVMEGDRPQKGAAQKNPQRHQTRTILPSRGLRHRCLLCAGGTDQNPAQPKSTRRSSVLQQDHGTDKGRPFKPDPRGDPDFGTMHNDRGPRIARRIRRINWNGPETCREKPLLGVLTGWHGWGRSYAGSDWECSTTSPRAPQNVGR